MSTDVITSPCSKCGADLEFKPGTSSLSCPYCGTENEIESSEDAVVEEQDFEKVLAELKKDEENHDTVETLIVKCDVCGAQTTLRENQTAGECAFCGSTMNAQGLSSKVLKPESLLPFKVTRDEAAVNFRQWLKKRWFAPKKLKEFARADGLKGIYSPFWTYDSETETDYKGQRGEYYYTTETYTTTEDGKSVTKTRQVRHTRWYRAQGQVHNSFDDVLIHATDNMTEKYVNELEPWDLDQLKTYNPSYLTGFQVESYSIGLEEGFGKAKERMSPEIDRTIRRHIGGDEQRIQWKSTAYDKISFKHILLPVWISSYRFKDKVYQFMVNARTGEVQGGRPWSKGKITLAVLAAIIIVGAGIYLYKTYAG